MATVAANPASQYHRQGVSSGLAGSFLQGQVSLSTDLLTATQVAEDPFGNRKHPAAEQPQAGDPLEEAGQAWGWGDPLCPRAQEQGPAACQEMEYSVSTEQLLLFLAVWFFYVFYLQHYF